MEQLLETITITKLTGYAVNVVGALLLLFVAWVLAGWAANLTRKSLAKAEVDETLRKFFSNFVKYLVIVLALLACLGIFGVETTSFAAVIAAAGFAIGLAFQGTLSNFSSGVMLLTFRPFKVGDVVSVGGVTGKVFEIELFTTKFDTPDNRRIVMPNSTIFGNTIENISFHDTRRVDVAVGTDYSASLAETRQVLERVANEEPAKLPDKDSQVYLVELGDSSINWAIRVWTKSEDYWGARERITNAVKESLDAAGIGIPYPQMDVHVDGKLG